MEEIQAEFEKPNTETAEGFGGPGRDRTDDLFHAMEARSQLRHRPTLFSNTYKTPDLAPGAKWYQISRT